MPKYKIVKVTQADISSGRPKNGVYCPVALAVRRLFPERNTTVGVFAVYINDKPYTPLPASAVDFIGQFDKGRAVKPFSFRIDMKRSRP